jgi:uncharacterized protein YchJ
MEFNYNKSLIRELLKIVKTTTPECKKFTDIKGYASTKPYTKQQIKEEEIQSYKERSDGEFLSCFNNKELEKISQEIKNIIKHNI